MNELNYAYRSPMSLCRTPLLKTLENFAIYFTTFEVIETNYKTKHLLKYNLLKLLPESKNYCINTCFPLKLFLLIFFTNYRQASIHA